MSENAFLKEELTQLRSVVGSKTEQLDKQAVCIDAQRNQISELQTLRHAPCTPQWASDTRQESNCVPGRLGRCVCRCPLRKRPWTATTSAPAAPQVPGAYASWLLVTPAATTRGQGDHLPQTRGGAGWRHGMTLSCFMPGGGCFWKLGPFFGFCLPEGGGLSEFHPPPLPPPLLDRPKFSNPSFSELRFWGKVLAPKAPNFFFFGLLRGYFSSNPTCLYPKYSEFGGEFKNGQKTQKHKIIVTPDVTSGSDFG